MNTEARILVEKTFEADFDRDKFREFIDRLLKDVNYAKAFSPLTGQVIRQAFREKVSSYERICQFTTADNKILDILIVNLKRDTTLERGRTGLRNFAADYLQSDRGLGKAAVLIAYVSDSKTDWRFSYVTLETELKQNEKGKFKEEVTNITPARRYSFLVGKAEDSHTAQKQFLELLETKQKPTLKQIEDAFNIEKVTKEFFERYKNLFEKLRDAINQICQDDETIRDEFISKGMYAFAKDEKGSDKLDENKNKIKEPYTDDFAKKLLGQIVFLYFLQKKGWFGVERGKDWGSGDKHFLRNLFTNKQSNENYFNDILEFLFYDALAVNRKGNGDFYGKLNCKIPFLNGGLFEPIYGYDWWNTDIVLPDTLFSNSELTKEGDRGTGILDVFDRYNFTINEAEPLEVEVAVDPEMLGKIFENLLPENIRHGSGTYYTPRVIVAYMCQQSLINYLFTHLEKIPREEIETFVRFGSLQRDYTEAGTQSQADKFLPQSIIANAKEIDRLLEKITVCDPAIGSGAFPVGMMQEIVKAREALQSVAGIPQLSQYELKRRTIEHSLYGVDIDLGAVEIAKLRLWLSLIVDEEDYKTIEPLPNLDYKIMQGNSLLDEFHGVKLIDAELFKQKGFDKETRLKEINEEISRLQKDLGRANVGKQSSIYVLTERRISELLKEKSLLSENASVPQFGLFVREDETQKKLNLLKQKHQEIFNETDKEKKEKLRGEAERLEWEFIESKLKADGKCDELAQLETERKDRRKNYFLWQLNFPEIFQNDGGFDVVMGNPPYVRQEEIKELKDTLKRSYQSYTGTADLYVYFYELGLRLQRDKGNLAFITSNKYFRAGYGEKLRELLTTNARLKQIIDFGDAPVFDATAYPCIVILQKLGAKFGVQALACNDEKEKEQAEACTPNYIRVLSWTAGDAIETFEQRFKENSFDLSQNDLTKDGWRLESGEVLRLLDKLREKGTPLGEYVKGRFYRGILTGFNEAFVVDRATRDRLIAEHPSSEEILKPFLRGRDVKRWRIDYADLYLIKIESSENAKHPWSEKKKEEAEKVFAETYPAIYRRFELFREKLIKRDDQGRFFWELRSCKYWQEFEQPKIIIPAIEKNTAYAVDVDCFYSNDKTSICVTSEPYFLVGILNSKLMWWLIQRTASAKQNGFYEFKPMYVTPLTIASASPQQQKQITELVDEILSMKREDPNANTEKLEREIDALVYRLYELTDDEIRIVEGKA